MGAEQESNLGHIIIHSCPKPDCDSTKAITSVSRQTAVLLPSFIGFGALPSFTAFHQVDLPIGIIGVERLSGLALPTI